MALASGDIDRQLPVPTEQVDDALTAVRSTLVPHLGADGVTLAGGILITTATAAA